MVGAVLRLGHDAVAFATGVRRVASRGLGSVDSALTKQTRKEEGKTQEDEGEAKGAKKTQITKRTQGLTCVFAGT